VAKLGSRSFLEADVPNVQEIATKAATYDPVRAVLTVLAAPFYVLGLVAAVLWLSASWVWAASVTGFADARQRAQRPVSDQ
jgi:hypothetical protein